MDQHFLFIEDVKHVWKLWLMWRCCQVYLVHDLEGKFLNHDFMMILKVIYPNFWVDHLTNVEMFSTNIWLSPMLHILHLTSGERNPIIWLWVNISFSSIFNVATLTLGSRPKQRIARLQAKREAHES
jgi:hypothetical protein